ncbi:uncharacterized protein TNIN_497891 [Trichonephila inaurata madagascariensis]|uniref:Uncharacterized protein n=1 Tax=Trichonephila inaurata madagascariensis TaxID=2747483 RepID=A0A8X7BUS4_9ARAC|nr:uncharacterized protein TNIN_497891 [Trichonephila inaurata madagascariensis]
MNPNDFMDDDVHESPLTRNWNGGSSQASQPPASLETRLQNLSLTAPVSAPEMSSLHQDPSPCPQHFLYWRVQNQIQAPQSRRGKPEKVPFYFNFRRERLRRAKERAIARISQNGMGSTNSMSSFPGADHEVNSKEDAAVGATCSTSTGIDQERNGGDSIRNETRKVCQLSHFWCFVCRQCKPRKNGIFCLSYFGNFLCEDCDKETKKLEFEPAKFHKDSVSFSYANLKSFLIQEWRFTYNSTIILDISNCS